MLSPAAFSTWFVVFLTVGFSAAYSVGGEVTHIKFTLFIVFLVTNGSCPDVPDDDDLEEGDEGGTGTGTGTGSAAARSR